MSKKESVKENNLSLVSINNHSGWIRLLYRFNGQRKGVNIGLKYNDDNLKIAYQKAVELENDIIYNRFDGDTNKYKIGYNPNFKTVKNTEVNIIDFPNIKPQFNLKDAWESYKNIKKDTVVASTLKKHWYLDDKIISLLESQNLLDIKDADQAYQYLLTLYKHTSLKNPFKDFRAAINLAIDFDKYNGKNTYAAILKRWPKNDKKKPESYTKNEVNIIVNAFKNNRFWSPNSKAFLPSYYANLVEFRFMVGCRPSEAIALTWDDIITENDKTWVIFRKAYVDGYLQLRTKTNEIRAYPCYDQVLNLLETIPKIENENNLIFPSIQDKGYIHENNFAKRYWLKIVRDGLFKNGEISKCLIFYQQRHTCGTLLLQSGIDIATIARILGNSPEVLLDHYLGTDQNLNDLKKLF